MPHATWRSSAPASSASRPRWRWPSAACGRWCWRRRRSAPAPRGATAGWWCRACRASGRSRRRRGSRRWSATGADAVFALIRRHAIACDAVQAGWLHPAHAASLAPRVAARAAAWQAAGARCVWLDAAETRRRMGSERFHGALFDPSGGHLDPLGYTRGLARAALAAGAAIHEATPVTRAAPRGRRLARSLRRAARCLPGGCWRRSTRRRRGSAGRDCGAAAGLSDGDPGAAGRPRGAPCCRAARRSPTPATTCSPAAGPPRGGWLWAAWRRCSAGAIDRLPRRAARRLEAVFPALGKVRFDHVWRGRAALTGDFLPRLAEPAPGLPVRRRLQWARHRALDRAGAGAGGLSGGRGGFGAAAAAHSAAADPAAGPRPAAPPVAPAAGRVAGPAGRARAATARVSPQMSATVAAQTSSCSPSGWSV